MAKKKKWNADNIDPWKVATVILAALFIYSVFFGFNLEKKLSKDEVKTITEDYITGLMQGQATAEVKEVTEEKQFYKMTLDVGGREYESYITKDGKVLFPQGMVLGEEEPVQTEKPAEAQPAETLPKTDKPEVELFVMSHCPFGTQAEKGILPAVRALGDSIDFKVRFVYYSMHGEPEILEESNQYCIQKEQSDKYLDYLACFLKEGNGDACLTETNVDKAKMEACVESTDKEFAITDNFENQSKWLNGRYPLFNTDADLNDKYSVGGSPTLIINGVKSSAGRDSASYLTGICSSFNSAPAACSQQLSSTPPSSGFGYGTAAAATAAGCGA